MNIESLINDNKSSIKGLLGSLNLNSDDMDKAVNCTKDVVGNSLMQETKKNGFDTLLNLFSNNDNSDSSNSFLNNLDSSLIKKLVSSGFGKEKANSIKSLILPFVTQLITSKIAGKSDVLGDLLGGLTSKKSDGLAGAFSNFFK
jgi:endonuclease III-like uncharacterized protein